MFDAIRGNWVAVPTPLSSDGTLDVALWVRHAHHLFRNGVDGIIVFGTTGEGPSFSAAERLKGIEALLNGGIEVGRLGLGCGSPAVNDTVQLARDALQLGVTQLLVLPPFYFRRAPAQGIEDSVAAILDGIDDPRLRATLYHIPQVSGVPIPSQVAANLRRRYGDIVAGVKDSSGNFDDFLAFVAAAPDLAIVTGNEPDVCRALAAGGAGSVSGIGSVAPALTLAMFHGRAAEAPMDELCRFFEGRQFEPLLKAVLAAQTGDPTWRRVRAPLVAAEVADGERIARWLSQLTVQA